MTIINIPRIGNRELTVLGKQGISRVDKKETLI